MPHVIVKMYAGRSEQEKAKLAEEITKAVMTATTSSERSISVSIEDVAPDEWTEKVYKPDIVAKWDTVYKKPGYNPV
jgi:4-oxalocrotonate tautomerase